MRIILTQDVPKLGNQGEVVEVAGGYARNYLIPRGLAVEATGGRLKELNRSKKYQQQKEEQELEKNKRIAEQLQGEAVEVYTRAGETGKLFGSVTNKEIAQAIEKSFKIEIERRKIELEEPIRSLGDYAVNIKLHPEVQARMQVKVVAEGN